MNSHSAIKADKKIDPDAALMKRIGAGQSAALSELINLHMHKIHAAAYRMLGDAGRAEDVTQMVFLKLWETAPQWEYGRANVLTYLYRLTTHRCLDILRKSKEALPGSLPDMIDPQPSAFDTLAQAQRNNQIHHALDKLSARQRAALTLFYYQHQSLKDAAEIMDITPTAFESLLRRARAALKPLLTQQDLETFS